MNDFFNNNQTNVDNNSQPQTVKIGEQDYSYEELNDLVSRGKFAREVETKYNTKLDRLMPEYTKATQKVKEYEPKITEYESKLREYESKLNPQSNEMSDDQKIEALKQAARIGLITEQTLEEKVTDIIDRRFTQLSTANTKISETRETIDKYKTEYGIEATVEDVLSFMSQEGIRNPKYAMDIMFGERLEEIRNQKSKQRDDEFLTQSSSTTGAKPYRADMNYKDKEAVKKAVREALRGER